MIPTDEEIEKAAEEYLLQEMYGKDNPDQCFIGGAKWMRERCGKPFNLHLEDINITEETVQKLQESVTRSNPLYERLRKKPSEEMMTFIKDKAEHEVFCAVANRLVVLDPDPDTDEGKALSFLERVLREFENSEHGRNVPKWLEE